MMGIIMMFIAVLMLQAAALNPVLAEETKRHSRWDEPSSAPKSEEIKEAAPARAPAAEPQPAPAVAQPTVTPKSDLPSGWDEPSQVQPGTVRLEDIKPGTRPKPQPLEAPAAVKTAKPSKPQAAPTPAALPYTQTAEQAYSDSRAQPVAGPPPPVTTPQAPYAAPQRVTSTKSDLPSGWEEQTVVPQGAVRLEDVKPGTKSAPEGGVAAKPQPVEEQKVEKKETIREKDVGAEEKETPKKPGAQRWQ